MTEDLKAVSYGIGMSVGGSLMQQNLGGLSVDDITAAIKDIFEGRELRFSPQEAEQMIQNFLRLESEKQFAANKETGEAFLAENSTKSGVKTTATGLQYEVLTAGEGPSPSASSNVTVHYHGTLINGMVFDSSYERGNPASFGVNQVIAGWTEALQLMNKGAKYRLYIPQELAYGANPHPGGPIEPYSALIFDVELIDFN